MLYQMLTTTASRLPAHPAIESGELSINYARLHSAVDRFAEVLRAQGIAEGERVAVLLLNGPEFVVSFFAVAKLGGREGGDGLIAFDGPRCIAILDS